MQAPYRRYINHNNHGTLMLRKAAFLVSSLVAITKKANMYNVTFYMYGYWVNYSSKKWSNLSFAHWLCISEMMM